MLRKSERLTREREINRTVRAKQYEAKSPLLYLVARDNSMSISRLAVITPRLLGNAVKRNRIRRLIFEGLSKIKHNIAKNIDIVIFPKKEAVNLGVNEIAAELEQAIAKIQAYKNVLSC